MTLPRLVVLISGGGTNLQALIDATKMGALRAQIALVVSNRRDAYGLTRARDAGLPTLYFPLKPYTDAGRPRADYDADLAARVAQAAPDLIVLAGWMHILSPAFLDPFPNQVVNLHPALPGAFAGANAVERAFEAFGRGELAVSGCMVHYVVPEVDAGPVIASAEVPFLPGDTLEGYRARLSAAEHQLIVYAVMQALRSKAGGDA
jgi:formyltetrahydrofolate-dependent phosphoribosylglycinamide formyltransferase